MSGHPVPVVKPITLHQVAGIIDSLTPRQRDALISDTTRGNVTGAIRAYSRATINALVNAGLAHTPHGNTALLTDDGRAVRHALAAPALPAAGQMRREEVARIVRRAQYVALREVAKHLPGFDPAHHNPERTLAYLAAELNVPWPEVK